MRRWLLVLVACGAKPAPHAVIGHRAATPAAPSCADVGVILRGAIEHADNADAGRAREAAIANACETDGWSAQVIACVASKPKPSECLDRLTPEQHGSYDEKLEAWNEQYGGAAYGGDAYGGDDAGAFVDCADAVKPALYTPALDPAGDPAWGEAMRKHVLVELCEHDVWDQAPRSCLEAAADPTATTACLAVLDGDLRDHVTAKVAEVDRIVGKLAAAQKQPKQITCDKIVAGYYADARWKDKIDWVKGNERVKMIAESRARMKKACAADKWSDTLRACISLGGDDACFAAASAPQHQWGFPARGVLVSTGVAECDAWGQAVSKLASCDMVPQTARDALQQAYEQLQQSWAAMPADARAMLAESCKQAAEAVRQFGSGCP